MCAISTAKQDLRLSVSLMELILTSGWEYRACRLSYSDYLLVYCVLCIKGQTPANGQGLVNSYSERDLLLSSLMASSQPMKAMKASVPRMMSASLGN